MKMARARLPKTKSPRTTPVGNIPTSNRPSFNASDIKAQLERYDRTPFLDLLTEMLRLFPDESSLAALAIKKPELYINSLISMARISGFTEKQEIQHNVTVNVNKMSDSQLEDHAKALLKEMQLAAMPVIELDAVHSTAKRAAE